MTAGGAAFTPPEHFEEYRLLRLLGGGAMGQVYLAQDRLLDRLVAVKFIAAGQPDEAAREQFFIEARSLARLTHPNVVAIYRVGEIRRQPYLISEYVQGQSLADLPRPVPWQRVLELGVGLCRGLSAAHRRGVLHRDIKPANAMLTEEGEVKLLDFGLAKLVVPTGAPLLPKAPPKDDLDVTRDSGVRLAAEAGVGRPPDPLAQTSRASPLSVPSAVTNNMVGSPLYMAPELWRGEPATPRSDVYAMGVLLYELCAGRAPYRHLTLETLPVHTQAHDAPPLWEQAPLADRRLCAVIDRCLRRDPLARPESADALREALEQLHAESRRGAALPEGSPYRGLHSFEEDHEGLFFGRDAEVRAIVERLRGESLVLVTGDSGVGKSSLCRAGVLSALGRGPGVLVARVVPGRRPLLALLAALAALPDMASQVPELRDEEALLRRLREEPAALGRALRQRFRPGGGGERLVLFVDQMEELLTLAEPTEAGLCAEVLGALVTLAGSGSVRLLGAVRSDFLTRLTALPQLGREVGRALYLLSPLSDEGLRQAIVQPALAKGVRYESPELVETLVQAGVRGEGGLPLLQFALAALWEARDAARGVIPAAALAALGGVEGALARHADQVLRGMTPPQGALARRLLRGLVSADGTRARRAERELLPGDERDGEAREALATLVRGRLVLVRADEGGASAYELAHEALLSGWGTLRELMQRDVVQQQRRQRLEQAAREWERLGFAPDLLLRGPQLQEVRDLDDEALGAPPRAFLRASRRAALLRRALVVLGALSVPLSVGAGYGALLLRSRRAVDQVVAQHREAAQGHLATARRQAQVLEGQAAAAYARFDGRDREGGEVLWAQVLRGQGELLRGYGRAARELETALAVARGRAAPRALLAEVLYEWALQVERAGAAPDELLERLSVYDEGGRLRARFAEPARLQVESTPAGLRGVLQRIGADREQRRVVEATQVLGVTPLAPRGLAPGSYVLLLEGASGEEVLRYPLLLRRGEVLALRLDVPPAKDVPRGFVYIPPGRFLFGSAADDAVRRTFYETAPQHEVTTAGYLISRTETTFGEWLTYLRALPPEERRLRAPRATSGFQGAVSVTEEPGGVFRLVLKPNTTEHAAREGELIRYPRRERRAAQDWLRFPVSGVSLEDAEAYAAWLRRSGRVPGARLCTEVEWERAARGADGRLYPHGDQVAADDANLDKTYGKDPLSFGPDEVGAHPASRSPFGVDDLLGNVWEWTRSSLSRKPAVVRGGSYYYGDRSSVSVNRQEPEPTFRDATVGVRLCANLPSPAP